VLVEDLDVHVVDRATQWNLVRIGDSVHHLMVDVVGGLGQPIGIDQLDPG
jgi:hypothetical protein